MVKPRKCTCGPSLCKACRPKQKRGGPEAGPAATESFRQCKSASTSRAGVISRWEPWRELASGVRRPTASSGQRQQMKSDSNKDKTWKTQATGRRPGRHWRHLTGSETAGGPAAADRHRRRGCGRGCKAGADKQGPLSRAPIPGLTGQTPKDEPGRASRQHLTIGAPGETRGKGPS